MAFILNTGQPCIGDGEEEEEPKSIHLYSSASSGASMHRHAYDLLAQTVRRKLIHA